MIRTYTLLVVCALMISLDAVAQFASTLILDPVPISINTGEKPQSKVWSHAGKFWMVLPNNTGTHLWRLDGKSWTNVLKLNDNNSSKADCKVVGEVVHILLLQGASSELVSVEYVPGQQSYQFWSARSASTVISLHTEVETATIEVDGTNRMWLAYDTKNDIQVRWSDSPYDTWSQPITLATGISTDDISAIIALPDKIGVLWSNQSTKRYGFRTHTDGAAPSEWTADEVPAAQSALNIGGGMADDHLNMVVGEDGTLYAAVKTSYDNPNYPLIALLVRRPSGTWDNLYSVANRGTRPIVQLDEASRKLIIVYTSSESGGNILYKETLIDLIDFSAAFTFLSGNFNNATSAKAAFREEVVILASSSTHAVGVLASNPIIPLPVELVRFTARFVSGDAELRWVTASEQHNAHFKVEVSTDGKSFSAIGQVAGKGTTQLQQNYSFTDHNIYRYRSERVYYRLRQVDFSGDEDFSPIRGIQFPHLETSLSLKVFPNPFKDYLEVQLSSAEEGPAMLTLYNTQGKEIFRLEQLVSVGINKIILTDLPQAEGIYFLSIKTDTEQKVIKVLQK
jgi:hypothetical protein